MSPELERVIGRAVVDKAFRDQLLADPEAAAKGAGISLNQQELAELIDRIGKLKFNATAAQLDELFRAGPLTW